MSTAESFNQSGFSRFINSPAGRAFRLVAGACFLGFGVLHRDRALGRASIAWSVLPLTAGALDLCFVSAALGGPLSGASIRELQRERLPRGASITSPTRRSP